jgi:hypothetical protein
MHRDLVSRVTTVLRDNPCIRLVNRDLQSFPESYDREVEATRALLQAREDGVALVPIAVPGAADVMEAILFRPRGSTVHKRAAATDLSETEDPRTAVHFWHHATASWTDIKACVPRTELAAIVQAALR